MDNNNDKRKKRRREGKVCFSSNEKKIQQKKERRDICEFVECEMTQLELFSAYEMKNNFHKLIKFRVSLRSEEKFDTEKIVSATKISSLKHVFASF